MKSFAHFHPLVLFIYYVAVICITMFLVHPLIIILSLLGALFFLFSIIPVRVFGRDLGFYIFVFLLIAVTNPLFVHRGETILFFLNDNPVTLEAIVYGVFISAMLIAIIFWSKSYSYLMTSDKFLYLFGRLIPKLSLVISMALRFIPLFKQQIKNVHQAQKTLGLYTSNSVTDRILSGVRTFNSVITWSLEHSIIQADAMKARGYGLKGRTNFSLFRWYTRDVVTFIVILLLFAMIMFINSKSGYSFAYYPVVSEVPFTWRHLFQFVPVLSLMILPTLIEVKENLQWKYLKSKI